jgi:transposase
MESCPLKAVRVSPTRVGTRRRRKSERFAVRQLRKELGTDHGTIRRVADQLDIGVESLRNWVKQAEVDAGEKPGTTTVDAARIRELEHELRELRRANAILRSASAFFAAELDRPQR